MAFDTASALGALDLNNTVYLRRRRLFDGPELTTEDMVEALKDDLFAAHDAAEIETLIADAIARKPDLTIVTLNTVAWTALVSHNWKSTNSLAREVINRDHHDLLAQRLITAANEQSETLDTKIDHWLRDHMCPAPFEEMESRTNNNVHFCCSAWQPAPIGKIDQTDNGGFWNSKSAKEIRRSVIEGDFKHCSRWHCPSIAGRRLPKRDPVKIKALEDAATNGPSRVILSHDRSCNISCPSCRDKLILMDHLQTKRLNTLFDDHLLPLVQSAKQIKVTGSGDPFGSRHFRHLIKQLTAQMPRDRRIQLHTNGLLANERAWVELDLWDHVSSVWVSIDAADPTTYQTVRRGGDMDTLLSNLRFLGQLRRSNAIDSFRLDFVVQASNYDELGDFVDLARNVGADGIYLLCLRNWGHFDVEAFQKMDVCAPTHPEFENLLNRLRDDRLNWDGIDFGSMTSLRLEATSGF